MSCSTRKKKKLQPYVNSPLSTKFESTFLIIHFKNVRETNSHFCYLQKKKKNSNLMTGNAATKKFRILLSTITEPSVVAATTIWARSVRTSSTKPTNYRPTTSSRAMHNFATLEPCSVGKKLFIFKNDCMWSGLTSMTYPYPYSLVLQCAPRQTELQTLMNMSFFKIPFIINMQLSLNNFKLLRLSTADEVCSYM